MSHPNDASALLRTVGLLPDGPVTWGRPVRHAGPGVFLAELPSELSVAPLELALIGKWLERVPDLRLDGARPSSRELLGRLASLWLPSRRVLLVGSTGGSVGGRLAAIARTVPGDRRPASSGFWLHFLRGRDELRLWWAETNAAEEYEDALLEAFAASVPPEEAAALPGGGPILPWATLRTATGERKPTGIVNPLLPDRGSPAPPTVTRVVELPDAEANGARDEARRPRRPARGRGVGRIASAAGYAARGSPRLAPEPVYLSPEGLERMQAELRELVEQRRPEVIRRIAAARELGDLSENAEYHAAREEGGFLEGKIRALEARLRSAILVAPSERGAVVELGSRVRVAASDAVLEVTIVGTAEADPSAGRISNVSPVGRALLGRRVGDAVTIRTPAGDVRYAVLAIE